MNHYEMMNQRVDQLRASLARLHLEEETLQLEKSFIMLELLDTRRQITFADRQDQLMNLRIPEDP